MGSKFSRSILLIIMAIFLSLACNLPNISKVQPTSTPVVHATVNPQQVFNEAVQVDPNTNTATITLTESQINGLIFTELQRMNESSQVPITDPSVTLQDGVITINGKIASGMISTGFSIAFKPIVTGDHNISFEVVKSDFGILPVPTNFAQSVTDQFTASVNESITASNGQVSVDSVTISDGVLVIVAHQ